MIPPPPIPPPPADVRVEALEKPVRLVAGIVLAVLSLFGTAAAAYYGATGKLERVAERTEQVAAGVAQLRDDTERRAREQQQALEARLSAVEAQRKVDEDQRRKDREELIRITLTLEYLQKSSNEQRTDMKVLLDRLNASPRTRSVRDYPQ
ncbi:hypothetical protein Mx9_p16 [Myxococcus phage Mx9]|nr:hypothetical protein Mx9_p16 [Myxococcus phage Mx9]